LDKRQKRGVRDHDNLSFGKTSKNKQQEEGKGVRAGPNDRVSARKKRKKGQESKWKIHAGVLRRGGGVGWETFGAAKKTQNVLRWGWCWQAEGKGRGLRSG